MIVPRVVSDYSSYFEKKVGTNEDFKKQNVFTEQQKAAFLSSRNQSYLNDFFASPRFIALQHLLSPIAQRLIYDKFAKSSFL